jgi:excinuclease UvrABC ATPase subunit
MAQGTPEQVAADTASFTGRYLRRALETAGSREPAPA